MMRFRRFLFTAHLWVAVLLCLLLVPLGLSGVVLQALAGLGLWGPRGALTGGFGWRRTPSTLMNLHRLAGFWVALPLAAVALTGIGLAFPTLTAAIFGAPAGVGGPPGGGGGRE